MINTATTNEVITQVVKMPCEGWFYWYDNDWTHVEDGTRRIATFLRRLEFKEVSTFKAGYLVGIKLGAAAGREEKAAQLRSLLGL